MGLRENSIKMRVNSWDVSVDEKANSNGLMMTIRRRRSRRMGLGKGVCSP